MSFTAKALYDLLPGIYRIRDAERGETLKALLGVIAQQVALVEEDIEGLYENWFIETCEEWLVPYLGDLLGVRPLHPASKDIFSLRAYVANTLAYRRRKGTLAVLEQLARDVTGWPAKGVEFFQLLIATQHLNHLRPDRPGAVQVCGKGSRDGLELLYGPFEKASHTVDVRRISSGRGKYNLPNVGLFLWRLQPYAIQRGTPRSVAGGQGCYTFSPLGKDMPLFNAPQTEKNITHLAEEINVPEILRRWSLYQELEARRRAIGRGQEPETFYFGENPVLEIFVDPGDTPLKPEEIAICNLEGWEKPGWQPPAGTSPQVKVGIDPVLGRLAYLSGVEIKPIEASYSYGFGGSVGGGPYDRRLSVAQWYDPQNRPVTWQREVTGGVAGKSLKDAILAWNDFAVESRHVFGLISIGDSRSYEEPLPDIVIPDTCQLAIAAAEWLPGADGIPGKAGRIVADHLRPHVRSDISVVPKEGGNGGQDSAPGVFILDGLLIEGSLTIQKGNLGRVYLGHCTLVPQSGETSESAGKGDPVPSLMVMQGNDLLCLIIDHSIVGPVLASESMGGLIIADSIIDAQDKDARGIAGLSLNQSGPPTRAERSTVFGSVAVRELDASEAIFTGSVAVKRSQTGCLRFSYVPLPENPEEAPKTPRRFRCQPCLEITTEKEEMDSSSKRADPVEVRKRVRRWLRPSFVSTRYGHPAYAQLSLSCPSQIRTGAEDGSEMGVFCRLKQPPREANLRGALAEYLRSGLEAGTLFVT